MSFSHKKMRQIENKINEVFDDTEEHNKQIIISFLKEVLKYDEKVGSYRKQQYENYNKKYNEEHKDIIRAQKAVNSRKHYLLKKQNKIETATTQVKSI